MSRNYALCRLALFKKVVNWESIIMRARLVLLLSLSSRGLSAGSRNNKQNFALSLDPADKPRDDGTECNDKPRDDGTECNDKPRDDGTECNDKPRDDGAGQKMRCLAPFYFISNRLCSVMLESFDPKLSEWSLTTSGNSNDIPEYN